MELTTIANIMKAAIALSGLQLPEEFTPNYEIIPHSILIADLCNNPAQCTQYKTFSPPYSKTIFISKEMKDDSIEDKGIVFHELVKYLLYANGKELPANSCSTNISIEAKIYKHQINFMSFESLKAGKQLTAEEVLNMNKGSYMIWCDPTKRPAEPSFEDVQKSINKNKV